MPSFNEPLKNWFGYSRRERRATFVLLIISFALICIRFILPEREIEWEVIKEEPALAATDTQGLTKTMMSYTVQKARKTGYQKKQPLIDINSCDSAMLERLPGIGPVLSARIVKYRNLLGGYSSVEQLKEVYGLSGETYGLVSGKVFADSAYVRKIRINKAEFRELLRFPYFTKYEVNAILKYRELNGSIKEMKDLVVNKIIPDEKTDKIRPYIEFAE